MKIIRFTALWCADCIVMRPRWEAVFDRRKDIVIDDYDFDDHEVEAKNYNVTKVPQLIFVNDKSIEIERLVGMQDQERLEQIIEKYFKEE